MKSLLALLLLCLPLCAATVELEWDDPENAAGSVQRYGVYLKTGDGEFVQVGSSITRQYLFQALAPGNYQARVTAVSAEGLQSLPSNTITFTAPAAPANLRIKIALEVSDDLQTWQTVAVHYAPEAQRRFYRLAFQP